MKRNSYIGLFVISMCMIVLGFVSIGYANHQGLDCSVCHDEVDTCNLHRIHEIIFTPNSGSREVWFTSYTGWRSFADGDTVYDGVCEVCHTNTSYHTNYGDGTVHYDGQDCTECHPHANDFYPEFPGLNPHQTHFNDPKGPQLGTNTCFTACHLSSSDFRIFKDNQPIETTNVCDPCHSPGGAFDGVNDPDVGAKLSWGSGIYEPAVPPEEWPSRLKAGKENWCATCHDDGSSVIHGVSAPNVMGNSTTYGYTVSGHGEYAVRCDDCHDLTMFHTDGQARTYSASSNNYREGYRLNEDMVIPRYFQYGPNAFKLCFKCHVYSDVLGAVSNFRDDNKGIYFHEQHLNTQFSGILCWDSDWNEDFNNCNQGECADSAISCTACHNVHGSPTPAMIRHGELISTPGTTDKVPALRFRWYDAAFTQTMILGESRYGGLLCGEAPYNVSFNHVCWGCHNRGEVRYYRVAPPPTIGYSPVSFSFTATPGGTNPPRQSLQIWNAGNGTLNWSVSEHATWLSLSPIRGTNSRTVYVSVNTTGLSEGTYIENIKITATGSTNSPVYIPVILTVSPLPTIGYTPASFSFTATQGGSNPPNQTLSISNTGGGTLSWSVSDDTNWLSLNPPSGTDTGIVTLSVNIAGLAAGTYNATITITVTGATNSPVNIPVTLTINPPPSPVTLLSPNGGEIIPSGSIHTIRWGAPLNAVKFNLKYSIDNGSTWILIARNRTGSSYNWTVPRPTGNKRMCLVKVIGFNASGIKVGEDISDSTFTIEVIKVTSPDGGEILKSGTTWPITWRTNVTIRPVVSTKLFRTINGGSTWTLMRTLTGNPNSFNWTVPKLSSSNCKVKVVLRDSGGVTVGSDISDAFFTIQP